MQDDFEEGFIDRDFTVVLDETEFPEFVHEEIHARTGGADHVGESLLGYFLQNLLGLVLFAVAGQEQ